MISEEVAALQAHVAEINRTKEEQTKGVRFHNFNIGIIQVCREIV